MFVVCDLSRLDAVDFKLRKVIKDTYMNKNVKSDKDKEPQEPTATTGPDHVLEMAQNNDESHVSEQVANADRLWADGLILLLHLILPIAITGIILGRKTIFSKLASHLDKSCISVFCPSFSKREKLRKWLTDYLPYVDGNFMAIWKDGSLLCTLINSVVPGACPNPHRHWKKPPIHGQALAYKYLGITPVFSETDFDNLKPSTAMEKLLMDYISQLQQAIDKLSTNEEITFSSRYVARGMGLVTGEQHRRTIIYIYPNCKGQKHMDDLLVNIRGPYNTYGSTILAAREFLSNNGKHLETPDKNQKSFLKSLSKDFTNLLKPRDKGPACDIQIKTEYEPERAKLIFIPNNSGVYEICLTTNGEHISGSPYNLSVEKNRSGTNEDLNNEEVKNVKNEVKLAKKKLNPVIFYEKLKIDKENEDNKGFEEETCQIVNIEEQRATNSSENLFAKENKKLKALAQRMDSIEIHRNSKNKVTERHISQDTQENSDVNLPILATIEKLNTVLENSQMPEKQENFGLKIIDTLREIPQLKTQSKPLEVVLDEDNLIDHVDFQELNTISDSKRKIFAATKSNPQSFSFSSSCEHVSSLEDSGTFVNEDIDPDSLSSSIEVSCQESIEEISDNSLHEVNNNDIMIKSNEDICYLILNQNQNERVYSKDFISCQDENDNKSKDDLSKSDPNLRRDLLFELNVSALSQDNVQEARNKHISRYCPSRMLGLSKHSQEGRIAYTRSHSYSQGSLLEQNGANEEGLEFKQHFLKRKAFWTNISMSNVNLHRNQSIPHRNIQRTQSTKTINVTNNANVNDENYKSRSLDYVRQRKKHEHDNGKYASVDDLNFPSVSHRKDLYLNQPKFLQGKQELYAVMGDKCSWSIHDKIKCFESTSISHLESTNVQTLPENLTVKTKIKERFEKAHTYFKSLENSSSRRHSFDAEGLDEDPTLTQKFASLRSKFAPKRKTKRTSNIFENPSP